ncbi:TIGR03756 family integrating conjugative element protein [Providencia rettgeri]|uniref:TIGR03756 family integrating conjugative element protein n=1 Tax=Providencia rettgeri TaxID=587 RepID=UPI00204D8B79|nr:TIGR03756 family integrating conjugative element protein [Providencia rettgeri]UPQ40183.1 TIGR03756 family integrating conjugative element protein [Providencia rettgeri]
MKIKSSFSLRRRWHKRFTSALLLGCALVPVAEASLNINTANIVASSLSPSCISWRINGICYWLQCDWGCRVRTSVRVSHFIPQAVVSTYHAPGQNPWTEMSPLSAASGGIESAVVGLLAGVSAGGGDSEQKFEAKRKTNLQFFYADAIGHPATTLIGGSIPGYSCQSAAAPLFPYYLSTLDSVPWRLGVPEMAYPEALIPGKREIGAQYGGNMWGNVYPRSGFVTQQDGDKAAAVVAQRVADIITRTGQAHTYVPLKGHQRDGYWPPAAVTENTGSKNHKWQRLSPRLKSSCAAFPDASGPQAQSGNYSWALWQPYSCCKRRGQKFLGSTTF